MEEEEEEEEEEEGGALAAAAAVEEEEEVGDLRPAMCHMAPFVRSRRRSRVVGISISISRCGGGGFKFLQDPG